MTQTIENEGRHEVMHIDLMDDSGGGVSSPSRIMDETEVMGTVLSSSGRAYSVPVDIADDIVRLKDENRELHRAVDKLRGCYPIAVEHEREKYVGQLENALKDIEWSSGADAGYCNSCGNHPSTGHAPWCIHVEMIVHRRA